MRVTLTELKAHFGSSNLIQTLTSWILAPANARETTLSQSGPLKAGGWTERHVLIIGRGQERVIPHQAILDIPLPGGT